MQARQGGERQSTKMYRICLFVARNDDSTFTDFHNYLRVRERKEFITSHPTKGGKNDYL